MELQVDVDEADVGKVKVGQKASFTVEAYPDRDFPADDRRNCALRRRRSTASSPTRRCSRSTTAELLLRPGHDRDGRHHRRAGQRMRCSCPTPRCALRRRSQRSRRSSQRRAAAACCMPTAAAARPADAPTSRRTARAGLGAARRRRRSRCRLRPAPPTAPYCHRRRATDRGRRSASITDADGREHDQHRTRPRRP